VMGHHLIALTMTFECYREQLWSLFLLGRQFMNEISNMSGTMITSCQINCVLWTFYRHSICSLYGESWKSWGFFPLCALHGVFPWPAL
jgi:hypothetical protein